MIVHIFFSIFFAYFEGILESFAKSQWVDESRYEVLGDNTATGAPKKAREAAVK